MQKIIQYTFFAGRAEKDNDFIDWINSKIEEGWQPFGGIASVKCYIDTDCEVPIQAMVKYEDIAELLSSGVTCLNCGKAKELKSMLVCPHVMANDNIDCHSGGI